VLGCVLLVSAQPGFFFRGEPICTAQVEGDAAGAAGTSQVGSLLQAAIIATTQIRLIRIPYPLQFFAFKMRTIERIVFQFRVVTGTPYILSTRPR
jgi:hypothetical protein